MLCAFFCPVCCQFLVPVCSAYSSVFSSPAPPGEQESGCTSAGSGHVLVSALTLPGTGKRYDL